MARCVVSVHVPKTGGSSLRHQLVAAHGVDKVLLDYADSPLTPSRRSTSTRSATPSIRSGRFSLMSSCTAVSIPRKSLSRPLLPRHGPVPPRLTADLDLQVLVGARPRPLYQRAVQLQRLPGVGVAR